MNTGLARLRPRATRGHRQLLAGSALLVVGAAIQAASGALFWLVAARLDLQADVGAASKLFTSDLFVTYLAGLGLPIALARYAADDSEDSDVTFTWGVIASVAAALVVGAIYVAAFSGSATQILTELHPVGGPLLFGVMVAGSALSLIVDVRCMTARRWNLVLARLSLVGLTRFPLLFLFRDVDDRGVWLFVAAIGPVAASGIIGAALVPRVAGGAHRLGPMPSDARAAAHYSAVNYVAQLAYQAPYYLLPVIVLANVADDIYASFNVAWGIVAVAFYVPIAIGQALLAEGGKDGAHVRHQVRLAMALAVSVMGVGALVALVGRGLIPTVYGAEYSDAARVLPAMVAAGVPWAITSLYLSEVRILHRNVATVVLTAVLTAAIIGPALFAVPAEGIDGASASWLLGNIAAATVAFITVLISRRLSRHDPSLDTPDTAIDAAEVGIGLGEPIA